MPPKQQLLVEIGGDRFSLEVAHVNDSQRPTEIDTDKFVGRVLVRVRDFDGVAPAGFERVRNDDGYFAGRSRKFAIQIEGRFKQRPGVEPYTADEVHFGSDFDHLVDFPRQAFNAGMKVAQWVDPCTFWEEQPPSKRPYIMSPYAACMNTLASWPAPARAEDAVVVLRHTELEDVGAKGHREEEDVPEGAEDLIPREVRDAHSRKHGRHLVRYWRFLGWKSDSRVKSWLADHAPALLEAEEGKAPEPSSPTESGSSTPARPAFAHQASLGVLPRSESPAPMSGAATPSASPPPAASVDGKPQKKSSSGTFGFGALKNALSGSGTTTPKTIAAADVTTADKLRPAPVSARAPASSKLDGQLGPYKFSGDGVDVIEDNTFVFVDKSVSTPKRRKHFADPANRKGFTYDPDVVYATSFFTPFCDLNTFDLKIGPVHLNIGPYFTDMPIRYTLRSTRRVPPADGSGGPEEEEVFATVSFRLVDV